MTKSYEASSIRLEVYKTLKRGRLNHWMLGRWPLIDVSQDGTEIYAARHTSVRFYLLQLFEMLCGYRLARVGKNFRFIFWDCGFDNDLI